jgi:hypothetical protein
VSLPWQECEIPQTVVTRSGTTASGALTVACEMGGKTLVIHEKNAHAYDQRELYRVALTQELRLGLAKRDGIDLRDGAASVTAVFVVFDDELVEPLWEELAATAIECAHLFVAPVDFASGALTMVTITGGSSAFNQADYLVAQPHTFGSLVRLLTSPAAGETHVAVLQVPGDLGARGFTYCCSFAEPVAV